MPKHTFAATFASERIDKAAGVIHGVAVATVGDILDGRRDATSGLPMAFDAKTLVTLMACAKTYAGGLKVKADHRSGVFATTAYLKNFRIEGQTLRADLHTLSTDENRDKLLEMAETIPDTFGLSVSFSGPDELANGRALCRCEEIYSADLVSEPAANPNGLFSQGQIDDPDQRKTMNPDEILKKCESMIAAALTDCSQKLSKLETAFASMKPASADEMSALKTQVAEFKSSLDAKTKEFEAKIADRAEIAASIAKEFAKVVGTSPAAGVSPAAGAGSGGAGAKSDADVGEELVQKHYAATKSKAKAFELAGKENPKAVESLVVSQRKFSYEKPTAKTV